MSHNQARIQLWMLDVCDEPVFTYKPKFGQQSKNKASGTSMSQKEDVSHRISKNIPKNLKRNQENFSLEELSENSKNLEQKQLREILFKAESF